MKKTLCLTLMILGVVPIAFADEALIHDPFARPLLSVVPITTLESGEIVDEEIPWSPTLTAVMVAGKNSVIILDGMIMKIGEVRDGYRLVQVKDHVAVFKNGKKRVVLEMKVGTGGAGVEPSTVVEPAIETKNGF